MTGRKTVLGLCMLCALALSAVAAQGASAKGTTAVTCVVGSGTLHGAHCLETGTAAASKHVTFGTTPTELSGTNANTASETTAARESILKETIAGTELELKSTGLSGTGSMTNSESGGEMIASGSGTITYSGVTVAKPAGKGCKVFTDVTATKTKGAEGVIDANVKATTLGQEEGKPMFLKFEPSSGTAFATFFVECTTKVAALEGTWEITGSIKCPTSGATVLCSHEETTTQNTLKGKGSKAGLDGALTIKGKASTDASFTPLSVTTE
jgi:hypothetical protein